jgi:signal transduction histidine kinase
VLWRCDSYDAVLEIADDGVGFPITGAGRLDSYGLLGMRERADSVGARLEVVSAPGKGTKVRCYLERN